MVKLYSQDKERVAGTQVNFQVREGVRKKNTYNLTKNIIFSMGPSVKFVLAIIDSISKKKWV